MRRRPRRGNGAVGQSTPALISALLNFSALSLAQNHRRRQAEEEAVLHHARNPLQTPSERFGVGNALGVRIDDVVAAVRDNRLVGLA